MKNLFTPILKFLSLFLGAMLIAAMSFAQIPQKLNYQGVVRDSKGLPLSNTQIGLRLSIQESGANPLLFYSEERLVTTNTLGLYSVVIGDGTATKTAGDFTLIPWGTGPRSLKVEVDVNGGTNFVLAGITPLVSVPYALYAKYAENGPAGPPGKDGATILSGPNDPAPGLGNPGDYYFNTTTNVLYGPQNPDGTWPSGTVLLQGPAGPAGPAGADGLSAFEIWQQIPGNENKTLTEYLDGLKGADGINCWDLNANGLNDPAEDINNDGLFNTLDCGGSGSGTSTLTDSHIFVGSASNTAQDVPLSGDAKLSNTGSLTIVDGAITLGKMANGTPDQIYTTDATGKPTLSSFNGIGWSLYGNYSTVDGTHFLGTTDDVPLNFRVNNNKSGRITNLRGETSLGYRAGVTATASFYNTLIGFRAGELLLNNSNYNTLIGAYSGFKIAGASVNNMAVGAFSLGDLTFGNDNMAIGHSSGYQLTSGNDNVFLGQGTGLNSPGAGNSLVLIGRGAQASPGLINAVAIGNGAVVTSNNSFIIGASVGNTLNVGIGTSAPTQKLHIKDGHLRSEQTSPPTISLSLANGFTGVALLADATDMRGTISLRGTTLDIVTFSVVKFDFNIPSSNSPVVTITPANLAAAQADYYVEPTLTGFLLYLKGRTAVISEPRFNYLLVE